MTADCCGVGRDRRRRIGEIANAEAPANHRNAAGLAIAEGERASVAIDQEDAILAAMKREVRRRTPDVPAVTLANAQTGAVAQRRLLGVKGNAVARQRQPVDVAAGLQPVAMPCDHSIWPQAGKPRRGGEARAIGSDPERIVEVFSGPLPILRQLKPDDAGPAQPTG